MRVVLQVVQVFILGLDGPFPPGVAHHVAELVVAGDFREDGVVDAVGFTAGERCARWHAHGRWRVGRVEDTACGCKCVEVRGLYLRMSRAPQVSRVPLVGTDEDYVGAGIHGWSSYGYVDQSLPVHSFPVLVCFQMFN